MPGTIEIVIVGACLLAAGAAIWAAVSARAALAEIHRQAQIALDVGLTVADSGDQLDLYVQNIGRVAATVSHVALQIDAPRLQSEHRERLEAPTRLTLAWQLTPARSTGIGMVSLVDLSEALLAVSVERAELTGLAWDQDGTIHRSAPMTLRAPEWRERGRIARMAAANLAAATSTAILEAVVDDEEAEKPAEPVAVVSDDTGPLETATEEEEETT